VSRHFTPDETRRMFAAFSKVDLDIFGTYHEIEGIPFGRLPLGRIVHRAAMAPDGRGGTFTPGCRSGVAAAAPARFRVDGRSR
jgi:hypothetical protein